MWKENGEIMVRPRRYRRIMRMPNHVYFKPQAVPLSALQEVILTVGEYEAIRLKDYENLGQVESAKKMDIHQSTFQRTLARARQKVADAIINGKVIKIEGGMIKMPRGDQTGPAGRGPRTGRGLRGRIAGAGRGVGRLQSGGRGRMQGFAEGPGGSCKCPECGYETAHIVGTPCVDRKCPKCGKMMTRA